MSSTGSLLKVTVNELADSGSFTTTLAFMSLAISMTSKLGLASQATDGFPAASVDALFLEQAPKRSRPAKAKYNTFFICVYV